MFLSFSPTQPEPKWFASPHKKSKLLENCCLKGIRHVYTPNKVCNTAPILFSQRIAIYLAE